MGGCFSRAPPIDYENEEVSFDHFKLLRSVGKGAFGKVCIVMKRDTKQLYAMKYMNKSRILQEKAIKNVYNERKILELLNYPLMVNLWFAFQDAEDMFMVVDLMLGGDLRYHLQRSGPFDEARVRVYMAELSSALEYIHSMGVIHRDIKPDNVLMDADGHVHLADFNVASFVPEGGVMRSRAGTRPYMAPEMVSGAGYTVSADWWSLGVTMYEMLRGKNPFRGSTANDVNENVQNLAIAWPASLQPDTLAFLQGLLERNPARRLGTPNNMETLKSHSYITSLGVPWDQIPEKKLNPVFVPDKDRVNCDAMYELEEMMLEENPLYKKKARLKKEESRRRASQGVPIEPGSMADELNKIENTYRVFNREKMQKQATTAPLAVASKSRLVEMKSGNLIRDEFANSLASGCEPADSSLVEQPSTTVIPEEPASPASPAQV